MIPIFEIPGFVSEITRDSDVSWHQKRHLHNYALGLIVSKNKTMTGIGSNIVNGSSARSLSRFLGEYNWDEENINKQRLQELQKHNETRWSKNGFCIIDDTYLDKEGKLIPFAGKFYDHSKPGFTWAQNIVTLHYADHKGSYPIDKKIYQKKEKHDEFATKIELAMELIEKGIEFGVPVLRYVFDSWYFCKKFTDFLESKNKIFIGACKSDLLVRGPGNSWISLSKYSENVPKHRWKKVKIENRVLEVYSKEVLMKSLERKIKIIISREKDEKGDVHTLFLATNSKDSMEKIVEDYILRWSIEQFYKDAKQHLGLGKLQARNEKSVSRHLNLVFVAHAILRLGVVKGSISKLASTIGKSTKHMVFSMLEKFVYTVLEKGEKVIEVLKVFLKY